MHKGSFVTTPSSEHFQRILLLSHYTFTRNLSRPGKLHDIWGTPDCRSKLARYLTLLTKLSLCANPSDCYDWSMLQQRLCHDVHEPMLSLMPPLARVIPNSQNINRCVVRS